MNERILVTKSTIPPFDEYINEIKDLWDSRWLTNMGEKHNQLINKLKDYLNVENVSLMCNGHMALEVALQAMDLKGEVITTPFTFISTTHAIVRSGLTPVFCDINDRDFTIDVTKIEECITDKTVAIVAVHVYGNVCDVEKIEQIAQKHNLKVIYDAAHAFGVVYKGKGIGSFGDASMFSFHATKVFNTIEGGAVVYTNKMYGKVVDELINFGMSGPMEVEYIGGNAKMNEFQASMGLCNLRHIEETINRRREIVLMYRALLGDVQGIKLLEEQKDVISNYAYFPIVVDETKYGVTRDVLMKRLREENIFAREYFYPIVNKFKCYEGEYIKNPTPIALYVSERVITLPLYSDMTNEIVERICRVIREG